MAITFPAVTVTMTDAEFLAINGVAAPTIPATSPFSGIGVTAASSAGTTTLTLPSGQKNDRNIMRLAQVVRRVAQTYRYTFTP